jgi:hypothetical protein
MSASNEAKRIRLMCVDDHPSICSAHIRSHVEVSAVDPTRNSVVR